MLFLLAFIIIFVTSLVAWVNTKIIIEDVAEIKRVLVEIKDGGGKA